MRVCVRCGYRRSIRLLLVSLVVLSCVSVAMLLQRADPTIVYFLKIHQHALTLTSAPVFNRHFDPGPLDTDQRKKDDQAYSGRPGAGSDTALGARRPGAGSDTADTSLGARRPGAGSDTTLGARRSGAGSDTALGARQRNKTQQADPNPAPQKSHMSGGGAKASDGNSRHKAVATLRVSEGQRHSDSKQKALTTPRVPHLSAVNGSALQVGVPVKGGLGNRMFQYASLLGIARMNGRRPVYLASSRLNNTFHVSHLYETRAAGFKVVSERHFASYDPKFEKLPQVNVLCMQYLQSWKYFHFIQADIRREFTFTTAVQNAVRALLTKQPRLSSNKTRVGVHVRLGDILKEEHIKRGYHTAPLSYVHRAMDYMRHQHPDVIFILVTQNPEWCHKEFNATDVVIAEKASSEVHMAVLASCNHVIMTVGTFGWWGGYLAGGEVVYWWDPKESLHDPPLPVEITKPKDFYLPEWIPLTG